MLRKEGNRSWVWLRGAIGCVLIGVGGVDVGAGVGVWSRGKDKIGGKGKARGRGTGRVANTVYNIVANAVTSRAEL